MEDSYCRYSNGQQGYWMDLVYALQNVRFPVVLPQLPDLTVASTRLYLLHGRLEPLEEDPPKAITTILRHYLVLVVNSAHFRALTRMLVSQHPLAVERLRYKKRFGCASVETVEHAMFFCDESALLREKRTSFALTMSIHVPGILFVSPATATAVLKALIFNRSTSFKSSMKRHSYGLRVFSVARNNLVSNSSKTAAGVPEIYSLKSGELVEGPEVVV
ncbi:hypothetical protein DFH09DRAFT_1071751 [Mycena vulgaris]|nr:hypothetical protein DFH09DRAFT_1071751 [Mycena vulgaris]